MSRAPKTTKEKQSVDMYMAAWHATMKLLREGRSFSGRERNCTFLNCHPGSSIFANVSAVTGLDYPDDGRAAAFVDWDHDGDLDLWLHDRTGPRLRLMRNQTRSQAGGDSKNFVAFRLHGTTSNRDAIGARVEVVLLKNKNSQIRNQKLIQTLYAGDGYLSQSSKWLHFGLGPKAEIDQIVVRWPGGKAERFAEVEPGGRYLIVEGGGIEGWSRPAPASQLAGSDQPLSTRKPTSRVYLSSRLPMPILRQASWTGVTTTVIEPGPGPRLICFWASWCSPCVRELRGFTEHEQQLRAAGVDILALSVDGLDETDETGPQDGRQLLEKINFPFKAALATPELLDKLAVVQRITLNRRPSFAVPTSFLLDHEGQLAALYRGPVDVQVLLKDVANLDATRGQHRDMAVPFSGRWVSKPRRLLLRPVAEVFKEAGYVEDYTRFRELEIAIKARDRQLARTEQERRQIDQEYARLNFNLGRSLQAQGQFDAAIDHFMQGLAAHGDDAFAHYYLARALVSTRQMDRAAEHFRKAMRIDPTFADAHHQLGKLLKSQHKLDAAIVQYEKALLIQSNDGVAHFDLGVALAARQDVVGATTHFRQAVELLPDNVAMRVNLGAVLASEDKLEEAIRHLRHALRLEPDDLNTLMNLGVALGSLGEFTEAADQFRRVVAIDPSHAGAHARLAQALIELSGPGQATEYLERAIMLDPDDRGSMIRLAWLYATCPAPEVRNGLRAVKLGERLQAMPGGKDPKMLDVLAAAYAEQGEYGEATRVASTALRWIGNKAPDYAKEVRKRLELYRARQPFRSNP